MFYKKQHNMSLAMGKDVVLGQSDETPSIRTGGGDLGIMDSRSASVFYEKKESV